MPTATHLNIAWANNFILSQKQGTHTKHSIAETRYTCIIVVQKTIIRPTINLFILFQIEHEGSNCQYEIVFGYADALTTSDRMMFMKFMIKVTVLKLNIDQLIYFFHSMFQYCLFHLFLLFEQELAEEEGIKVTFMPVPLPGLLCGNCTTKCG